jgi:hypothetical protein
MVCFHASFMYKRKSTYLGLGPQIIARMKDMHVLISRLSNTTTS